MSTDKRELIIVRLQGILEEVAAGMRDNSENPRPHAHAYRNKIEFSETQRPTLVILDGDEQADESSFGKGRRPDAISMMRMTPEIYFIDSDAPSPEQVGPRLSALRSLIVKAILTDSALISLVGTNGDIRYEGMATGLSIGRSLQGEAAINLSLGYPLMPGQL